MAFRSHAGLSGDMKMFTWAWKTLLSQRSTLVGSSLGIAGAFVLVMFFQAVFRGESDQIVAYPEHMAPDVWVMQTGVANMHMAMSSLWDWKADVIARMPEVKQVTPILYLSNIIDFGKSKLFAFIVGLRPDAQRAGPWAITAGERMPGPGEAIIPDVLSSITGIGLGDNLQITDRRFRVVGLSHGTYSAANAVIFVPFADLEEILSAEGTYSYLLVDAREGVDAAALAAKIRSEVEKVNAIVSDELVANDFSLAMQMGVEIIFMMTMICSALAALIVGFTAYSLVMRMQRELAIIKALGGSRGALVASVVLQSLVITALGYLLAVTFAFLVIPRVPLLVPQLSLSVTLGPILNIGVVALFIAVVGALIPAWVVARLDPATAYHV
ncbi:MAG TPA: FtsX-like permease family protein [Gammaproteobacteria bacterium]|nr:FtsX-like permease family protein [Gammaproteobacteria bacterium]